MKILNLERLEHEHDYLHQLVQIQWNTSVYNGLSIPIDNRISEIQEEITELERKGCDENAIQHLRKLLEKYRALRDLYRKNHPWKGLYNF